MKSIYEFIIENTDSEGFLPSEPLKLPDHDELDIDMQENWVPGEFEAVMVRLPYRLKEMAVVNYLIARTVRKCIKEPSQKNKRKLFAKLKKYAVVTIADSVLSHMSRMNIDKARAVRLATDMITRSKDRSVVKFGIVLLGAYGKEEHCGLLHSVGIHEEFTFFACKAIKNLDKHVTYQDRLVALAERTSGWGKIAVILEFSDHALTDETREWILKYGCKNSVALYFSACECAIKGDLDGYLQGMVTPEYEGAEYYADDDMTEGICDIIEGLLQGSSIKEADGVNEVPNIKNIAKNIKIIADKGGFYGNSIRINNLIPRLYKSLGMKE